MNTKFGSGRILLWLVAALLFVVAMLIGAGAMRIIGDYSSPYSGSGSSQVVFWICMGFSYVAAVTIALIATQIGRVSLGSGLLLGAVMLMALLFSFVLSEAAFGYDGRGPALQIAATILHLSSAADFTVALLLVIALILLPKRTEERSASARWAGSLLKISGHRR